MSGLMRIVRLLTAIAAVAALAACSAVYRDHGYVPDDELLAEITVGVDTRESVASAIGQPGVSGLLTGSAWFYVQSRFRHYSFYKPEEIDREVVAISFTPAGVVQNIERFGLEDGQVVVLSRRVTDSNIQGVSFLRQLFGNFGRIDVGKLMR